MTYGKRQSRSLSKRILGSPFTLAAAFIVFGLLSRATWNVHEKALASAEHLEQTKMSLEKISKRQADLSQKVSYLSTDEGIKSEIRDKFRAAGTGESVAVIVDTSEPPVVASTTPVAKPSFWSRILGVFGL